MIIQGTVLRSTGSFYDVRGEDGNNYVCKTRGKLRLEGIRETNPVAVGDRIVFESEGDVGVINEILPRQNHILRQSVKKSSHAHILAANVDQALLVATIAYPRTSLGFIDRFMVSAESFRIPQVLVFNKTDILDEAQLTYQREIGILYERLGVRCIATSAIMDDLSGLGELLKGKITLVAGHSGVGKSTILNLLSPAIRQKVAEVSGFSEKGTHTTTFAEMFQVDAETFVIDTPGVKEWGLVDMNDQELSDYFPEMRDVRLNCKFGSKCIHLNEPGCAVLDALHRGEIAVSRFESYLSILAGEDNRR
jgi:ribosome biogenesis GTPase / thiamine phosphate phosphatase